MIPALSQIIRGRPERGIVALQTRSLGLRRNGHHEPCKLTGRKLIQKPAA